MLFLDALGSGDKYIKNLSPGFDFTHVNGPIYSENLAKNGPKLVHFRVILSIFDDNIH